MKNTSQWRSAKEKTEARLNELRDRRQALINARNNAGSDFEVQPPDPDLSISSSSPPAPSSPEERQLPASVLEPPDLIEEHDGKPEPVPKRRLGLAVAPVTQTNIHAQEILSYSKETQTTLSGPDHRPDPHTLDYYVLTFDGESDDREKLSMDHPHFWKSSEISQVTEIEPQLATEDTTKQEKEHNSDKPKDLSNEEKQTIIMSSSFQLFMDKTSRVMERVLSEQCDDILFDYAKADDADEEVEANSVANITLNRVFYDEKWSKNRCVTCMDWSERYPELLVASYSKNEAAPHDPDGVCLIWNTKFQKTTPEYVFHCQSPVTSTCFANIHPNLVLGGTYSGSIVLWDNRVEKKTPVQRSPLTTSTHTVMMHPVYCLKVVGTPNSHNIISVSTDGKLCSWSLDMLAQPQEILDLELIHPTASNEPVASTCLTFLKGSMNNFIIGTEEGTVYSGCRHGPATGIIDAFKGHHAPVTGINANNVSGPLDFSHLFLTSSFDWSVKLWSLKESKPIYSFDVIGDYVYDVAWSPINPAVFATVDGGGKLDIWNLNNDTELPAASIRVDSAAPVSLNQVSWNQSGFHVTCGDDRGKIWVYDVEQQLVTPTQDEWIRFAKTMGELKENQADNLKQSS